MQSDSKIFIGGISWDTSEDRLKEYFGCFGEVLEAVIMKDRTTGRGRGFGFVVFADAAVSERVIKEKHNIDGRMVEAKKAVPKDDLSRNGSTSPNSCPIAGRTRKIFVGGLSSSVTDSDFRKYFEQFGTITDVVVMYDHNTQRPRGFGFITYDSEEVVDRVLFTKFHELKGKMVEVKRAVPKELSPSPTRTPLSGYTFAVNRLYNFPNNGCAQEYGLSQLGGYGHGMDSRFRPVISNQSGIHSFGSNYGIRMDLEPTLSACLNSNMMRGLNPYHITGTNKLANPIGYGGGNVANTSFFSTRNLWGNADLNHNSNNSTRSNSYIEHGSENAINWGSLRTQVVGSNFSNNSLSFSYSGSENSLGLGSSGYGRNIGSNVTQTASYGGFDGAFPDHYTGSSDYGDTTWRSSNSGRDGSGSLSFGPGNSNCDVLLKGAPGFVGGFSVNEEQPNRGAVAWENHFSLS